MRSTVYGPRRTPRLAALVQRGWLTYLRKTVVVPLLLLLAVISLLSNSHTGAQQTASRRIISLVPALTEMVFAIGAGDRVVAVSSYDDNPPQVRSLPRVGALLDPDLERILSLKPDLVLVYGSQTDLMQQLTRASVPFFSYRHAGLAGVTATIRELGKRTGQTREGESVARGIEQRLEQLRKNTATPPKPRTLLVFGRERGSLRNIYASGGRGFLHDMLEAAGGVNVFADIDAESVQATSELILTRAPDVIVEIRSADILSEADRAREIDSWQPLASVPAVRTGRIHLLTRKGFAVPGPGIAESAEELARTLHPQ